MSSLCPSCAHKSTDTATHCTECGQALLIDGRLRLIQKLGQGGSSSTFVVQDPQGKQGALKLLHLERLHDWKALEMFERQFKLLKSLDHPGIPKVFEVFEVEIGSLSRKALYQEYIKGDNLRVSLSEGDLRFDEFNARKLLSAMLEILEYLHGHSPPIIHRDIKPSNIILRADGSPVLIDFDTASGQVQEVGRGDNTMVGTAGFVPMEQLAGMTKPASDLYALGMTMVAVLTQREVTTLPMQAMRVQFEPHVNVSSSLSALIAAMIEPDIAKRVPSAQDARAMLEGLPATNSRSALLAMRTDLSASSAPPRSSPTPLSKRSKQPAAHLNKSTQTPFDEQLRNGFDGQAIGQAQRTPASEVKGQRFKRNSQFLWAASAHASSNYGGSWDIKTIVGEPRVFPKHGDIQGAWAQKDTRAGVVTLDIAFRPDHPQAQELWVFETYNAGAVFAAATLVDDQWHLIWQQQHQKTSSQAHILKITIPSGLTGSIWRLWLDTSKRPGYNEIDAVALSLAQEAQQALVTPTLGATFDASYGPTGHDVGQGERLSPAQLNQLDFTKDPRFIWAKDARTSSNYGGSWDVKNVRGTPKVFPNHGDIQGAWAQDSSSAGPIEWLKVSFGGEFDAVELWILETYNPGYIFAITSAEHDQEVLLWQREPQRGINEARALMVSLDPPRAISLLTIWLDRSGSPSYNEIDAVAIVGQRRAQPTALVTTAQAGHDKRPKAHASAQVFLDLAKQDATALLLSEERHMERSKAHASSQVFIELAKQDAAALKLRRLRTIKKVSIVAVFVWFIALLWMFFF